MVTAGRAVGRLGEHPFQAESEKTIEDPDVRGVRALPRRRGGGPPLGRPTAKLGQEDSEGQA